MCSWVLHFINKRGILHAYQFGLRMQLFLYLWMIILVDLGKGDFVPGRPLDFPNALNTLITSILHKNCNSMVYEDLFYNSVISLR